MKARIVTTVLSTLIALALGLLTPRAALAAECTWTGSGVDASWNDPLNWSGCGGNYPETANGNTAHIPAAPARQPRVNASMTLDGVRIDAGAALTVSADVTLTLRGVSAISGTLAVTQKGVLQLLASSPVGAQAVFVVPPVVAGDLEMTSAGGAYTPTLVVANGPLTIGATGRLRVTAGAGGGRVIQGSLANYGTVELTSGHLEIDLDKASGAIGHLNAGHMVVAGDVTGNADVLTNTGSLEFVDPATLPAFPSSVSAPSGISALIFSACGLVRNGVGGTIKVGAGTVTTTISAALENGGVMTVTSPLVLDKAGGAQVNSGRMVVTADVGGNGAVFTNTGSLEFRDPATLPAAPNGVAQPQGGLSALAFGACGLVRNGAGGSIKVGAGALTTTISAALENGGVMTVTSPLVLDKAGGALTNAGSLALAGGNVDLVGDYTQTAPGALNVAIGGTTPRTQYPVLNVSGAVALTGGLNLMLINGFVPANGDTFTFLNAGTRSGTFSTVTGTAAPGGKLLVATYGATYARIVTLGQALFLPLIRR